ncbi:epidermal growth factor-like protein 7 isoform X3 [Rhinolophus ferrumequinum]|uniref:epidermal growth factor-like protein 7 isoform X3 n=1 Tax=Rhinolophus ferrumequinum TaxID=59479 RepID=UPI00140FC7AB|nr:epidermal growth factor-like protein 7 isoform X3 [Rhinolophus ferrumequinum]
MASGGVPGRLARGRVHPRPKEAAVVAMAQPGPGQRQTPAQGRHRLPPPSRRAAAASVQGMRETPSPAAGCVPLGIPGAPCPSPSCSVCTSPSSPPAMGTEPAAPTGPSTGLPTAEAPGRPPPGLATPAAPAGRGPEGSLGPVEQQYASHHARMEGAVSSQAAATAPQGGGEIPARQMWMNAVLEGVAVPSAVSTLWVVTGANVRRGTAHLWTGSSACPREGPPGWPQIPPEEWTVR